MSKLNTIKNQILLGFMLISVFVGIIIFISYSLTQRLEEISSFKTSIEEINKDIYYMMYIDNRILNEDVKDATFHLKSSTFLLNEHAYYVESIKQHVSAEDIITQLDEKLINILDNIRNDIRQYDSLFEQSIRLYRIRGFKDYGLEGSMREFAHNLEEYSSVIALEDLLSLRRHEKDYFMRDDSLYKIKLNNRSELIRNKLDQKPSTAILKTVVALLEKYTTEFNRIYQVEQQIGTKDFGLIHDLSICQSDIKAKLDMLRLQATLEAEAYQKSIYASYWTAILVCLVLGVMLSVLIARWLSRPVRKLASMMEKPLKEQFETKAMDKEITAYSSQELIQLQQSFQKLLQTIQEQIAQISKNNELLKTQNEELFGMNEKISESQSKLQEALSVKDKFFSIIAHDLRGPMASLSSFLKMFIDYNESFSKEETRMLAGKMQLSTESLSNLLENLLTWSRSQMGKIKLVLTKVNIEEVIRQNFALLSEKAATKGIALCINSEKTSFAWTDQDALDFVSRNLLSNALKFSYPKSQITVSIKNVSQKITIAIKDTGIGMTQEQLEKLFSPTSHFTTRGTANEKGTGLGLMLCKEFIESVGGKISVSSTMGKGTTFTIVLDSYIPKYHTQKGKVISNRG